MPRTMRAAVFEDFGGPEVVEVRKVPIPEPGPGEVRVKVEASAMNHLDLWVRRGLPIETPMPHIGGSDIAGVVDSVGPGADDVPLGTRVVVDPSLGYEGDPDLTFNVLSYRTYRLKKWLFLGRAAAATIVGDDRIAAWEGQVSSRTRFIHVLFFQAVVPSEVPGYVLGVLRYRVLFYLAALGITELPYAVATVYLGDSFLKGESGVFILLGIAAITLAAFVVQIHRRLGR